MIKGPESDRARKILNDPRKAQQLVDAIIASREAENGEVPVSVDGLRVTLAGRAPLPVEVKES